MADGVNNKPHYVYTKAEMQLAIDEIARLRNKLIDMEHYTSITLWAIIMSLGGKITVDKRYIEQSEGGVLTRTDPPEGDTIIYEAIPKKEILQ